MPSSNISISSQPATTPHRPRDALPGRIRENPLRQQPNRHTADRGELTSRSPVTITLRRNRCGSCRYTAGLVVGPDSGRWLGFPPIVWAPCCSGNYWGGKLGSLPRYREGPSLQCGSGAVIVSLLVVVAAVLFGFVGVAGGQGGFSDVGEAGVHESAVRALAADGVFEGTECDVDRFCPGEPILRWVMAVWLVRVLDGEDPVVSGLSQFSDVDGGVWWAAYVERLADLGVTRGCGTGPARFCPGATVTRAQMATFLTRAFDLVPGPSGGFVDVGDSVHAAGIDALAAAGVTKGCGTGPARFCPGGEVTRAQMSSFLTRARDYTPPQAVIAFNRLVGRRLFVMDADGTNAQQIVGEVVRNPVWSPDGTRIAFHKGGARDPSERGRDDGIWVVDADGTNPRRVTSDGGRHPVWHPDGERLLYEADWKDMFVVNVDGTGRRQFAGRFGTPVWSPDGKRIAYTDFTPRREKTGTGIWVMDADGTNRQQLDTGGYSPMWSPDGTRIAYQVRAEDRTGYEIWVVDADGTDQRRLTTSRSWFKEPPVWSPDGSRMAYSVVFGGLYVVDSNGGNPELLTDSGNGPAWSPDGSRIVYGVSRPAAEAGIYVVDSDGGNIELLTASSSDAPPEWSPDGSRILFLSGDAVEFFVMDPDGGNPRSVASLGVRGGHVLSPGVSEQQSTDGVDDPLKMIDVIFQEAVWSPDGSRIVYNDGRSLYVINADGSNSQRVVVARCGVVPSPVWSPDGTRISYEGRGYIVIVDVETGRSVSIFDSAKPIWSPDGTRISYTNSGGHGIFVSDLDGTNRQQLSTDRVSRFAWSPDGARIGYIGQPPTVPGYSPSLYVTDSDGQNQQQLVSGIGVFFYTDDVDEGLAWSPDSSRIAYRSSGGINVIGVDGTNPRKVVSGFARGRMAWSPDGTRITYTNYREFANSYGYIYRGSSQYSVGGISVVNADGTNRRQITEDRDLRPTWVITSG